MKKATLTLTAYNMGDVSEQDFDAWATFVANRIDELTKLDVTVIQRAFQGGASEDKVTCDCPLGCDCRDIVKETLHVMWDEFCADATAWGDAS
jgi:hypothetical protein